MKMKKLIGIVLAAACMVSLAGCGSSEKKEVNVEKPEDLKTLTIGVQQGTTGDILSSDQVEKDSQMKRYPKGSTAIQALKNGKIDCVVIDSEPAAKFGEKNQDLKIIDGVFETEEYAMCVKKGNTELLDEMNKALEELKEDGTVDKIIGNYIGMTPENISMNLRQMWITPREHLLWLRMQNLNHTSIMKVTEL